MSQKRFAEIVVDNILADLATKSGLDEDFETLYGYTKAELKERWIQIVEDET